MLRNPNTILLCLFNLKLLTADDSVPAKEPASLEVSMRPKTRAGNLAFDLTFDTMMPDTSNKKKAQLDKLERRKSKRKKKKTLKEIQSDLAVAEERRKVSILTIYR